MDVRSIAPVRQPAFTPTKLLEKIPTDNVFGVLSTVGLDEEEDEKHTEIDTATPAFPAHESPSDHASFAVKGL
jgi:hypothetical protein